MNRHSAGFVILAAGLISLGHSQTCNLRGPSNPGTLPGIRCLDITTIENDTILVPSNVTVIGQNGISVCPIEASNSQIPAVIFIMDQSASMGKVFSGIPAGDPQGYRANVVHNALNYLYQTAGSGWFSYIEFATDIEVSIQPEHADCIPGTNDGATHLLSQDFLDLNPTNLGIWASADGPIQNRCNTGTNYYRPLHRAKEYIASFNPGDVNPEVSVIFISDGRPNKDTDRTFDPLDEDYEIPGVFPPIHGIFLGGDATTDGDVLAQLSTATNGTYNLVNGADTANLTSVMNRIINTIVRFDTPSSVSIQIDSERYNASGVSRDALGGYQVTFPQSIPLDGGMNRVELATTYRDTAGINRTRTVTFFVDVSGPPASQGVTPTDNYFVSDCAVANILKINDLTNPSIPSNGTLTSTPIISTASLTQLSIDLAAATHRGDSSGIFKIISKRTGDLLEIQIPANSTPGSYIGNIPAQNSGIDLQGVPVRGNLRDKVLQYALFDTLLITWHNPTDQRDSMHVSVVLYQPPTLSFGADTLGIDQITTYIQDVAAMGAVAPFTLMWANGTPVGNDEALRNGTTNRFSRIANMKTMLRSAVDPRLVVIYTDPLFNQIFTDTVSLIFRTPVMPRVWMTDVDGDGKADQMTLAFSEAIPEDQQFGRLQVVWGSLDQDTLFLSIDSVNPAFTDYVEVVPNSTGQRWIITLPQDLPFGHTSGSGPQGQGILTFSGTFDDKATSRILDIEDRVGPVLLEMWVDPKDIDLSYFKVSEILGAEASIDWFLVTRGTNPEMGRTTIETNLSPAGIYSVRLLGRPENRIIGGDKVRFVPERNGGVRDRNGTGAHEFNPPVIVRGFREPITSIQVSINEPLVEIKKDLSLPPPSDTINTETHFRILEGNSDLTQFTDIHTGSTMSPNDLKGLMMVNMTVQLPMLNGVDSVGNPLEGFLIDQEMAWSTEITVITQFFDQIGQFITQKKASLVITDPTQISPEGQTRFFLLWQPDPELGLVDKRGRAVASGVIIAKVSTTSISTALKDLTIYDVNGEVSKKSISVDSKRKTSDVTLKKIGYRRN